MASPQTTVAQTAPPQIALDKKDHDFDYIEEVEWGLPRNDPGYDTDQSLAPQPRRERSQEVCGCPPGSTCLDDSCVLFACYEECRSQCHESCQNRRLTDRQFKRVQAIDAGAKGRGLILLEPVKRGDIVLEYVGKAVPQKALAKYFRRYRLDRRLYIMSLGDSVYLDARRQGNVSRYINHSCEPNCQVQRWKVRGVLRAAVVATKDLATNTELTFDYQWERQRGRALTKCYCATPSCRGTLEIDVEELSDGEFHENNDGEYDGEWKPGKTLDQTLINRIVQVQDGANWRVAEVVGHNPDNNTHQLLFRHNLEEVWMDMNILESWKVLEEPEGDFMIAKKTKAAGDSVKDEPSMLCKAPKAMAPLRNYLYVQTPVKQAFWAKHLVERVERSCQVLVSAQQMSRPPFQPQSDEDHELHRALDQSFDGTVWRIAITGTDIQRAYTVLSKNALKSIPVAPAAAEPSNGAPPPPGFRTELVCPRAIADTVKFKLQKEKSAVFAPSDSKSKAISRILIQANSQAELENATTSVWALLLEACGAVKVKLTDQGFPCNLGVLIGTLSSQQLELLLHCSRKEADTSQSVAVPLEPVASLELSNSTFFKTFETTYKCSVWIQSEEDKDRIELASSRKVFLTCDDLQDAPTRWGQIIGRAQDLERGIRYMHLGKDRIFQQLLLKTPAIIDFCRNVTGSVVDVDPITGDHLRIDGRNLAAAALPPEIQPLSPQDRASVAEEIIRLQVELFRDHSIRRQNQLFGRNWSHADTRVGISESPGIIGVLDRQSAGNSAVEIASIVAGLGLHEAVAGHAAIILYRFVCTMTETRLKAREVVLACVYLANKCQKLSKTKKLGAVLEMGYTTFYRVSAFDQDSDEALALSDRVIAAESEVLRVLQFDVFVSDTDWLIDTIASIPKLNSDFVQSVTSFCFSGQVLGAGPELWLKYGVEYIFAVSAAFLKAPLDKLLPLLSLNPIKVNQAAELLVNCAKYGKPPLKDIPSNPLLESHSDLLSKYLPGLKEKCTKLATERLSGASTSLIDVGAPQQGRDVASRNRTKAVIRGIFSDVVVQDILPITRVVMSSTNCDVEIDPSSTVGYYDLSLSGEWRAVALANSELRERINKELPSLEELPESLQESLRQGKTTPGSLNAMNIDTVTGWKGTLQPGQLWKDGQRVGGKSCVCASFPRSSAIEAKLRWWIPPLVPNNGSAQLSDLLNVRSCGPQIVRGLCETAKGMVGDCDSESFSWLTRKLSDQQGAKSEPSVAISIQRWPSEKAGRREDEKVKRSKGKHKVGFSTAALQELQLLTRLHRLVPAPNGHPNFVLPVGIAIPDDRTEESAAVSPKPTENPSSPLFKSPPDHDKLQAKEQSTRCHPHLVFHPTPFVLQRFLSRKNRLQADDLSIGSAVMAGWFFDLVSSFSHCHQRHVVVRQLQPDQILIDQSGVAKLSGLYRSTVLSVEDRKKSPNPVRAARAARKSEKEGKKKKKKDDDDALNNVYAAPENLLGSPVYSKESDVWMLGCMLAHLLLGKPLFLGKERSALLNAQFKVIGTVSSSNFGEAVGFPHYTKPSKRYKPGVYKALTHLLKDRAEEHSSAMDLISKMLCLDPKDRCSVADALEHDFFKVHLSNLKNREFRDSFVREWGALKHRFMMASSATVGDNKDIAKQPKRNVAQLSTGDSDEDDLYDMDDILGSSETHKKPKILIS